MPRNAAGRWARASAYTAARNPAKKTGPPLSRRTGGRKGGWRALFLRGGGLLAIKVQLEPLDAALYVLLRSRAVIRIRRN
jgi:hypothetical protein